MPSPDNNHTRLTKIPQGDSQLTEVTGVSAESSDGFEISEPQRKSYGRYTIQGNLGSGGFGHVYLAEDEQLKRLVAVKIPRMSRRAHPGVLELYKREAQTVAALDLPGVVPIYDIGVDADGAIYIVSKYIRGSDLYGLMDRGKVSREQAVRLCVSIAETLHQVHLNSIVHRDIKPGNILVDSEGNAFVSDFGLALRPAEYGRVKGRTGTLRYMSPEQVRGESHLVDGRSDLFSLGVILYELLTGRRPFEGPDQDTIEHCIQFVEPKPLRQIDDSIHPELERICLKVLAKKASERYATGQDFADDLSHWISAGKQADKALSNYSAAPERTNVVPRGLRAFRGRDSGFFMSLLPGPRDRDGLPDIVRHWKAWIQERSSEDEYRVGAIYGPSGCGKSSLLQAGILPLVGSDIDVAMIQATGDTFNEPLRRALLRHVPIGAKDEETDITAGDLIARRRSQPAPDEKPLLLVIDQFENWLLNCSVEEANELAMALRQCDGVNTKALLLVRDDFWVALGRFMSVVDVPLIPELNCSLVDLFDPAHAKRVLESFGYAHNRLPPGELIETQHEQFLEGAVNELTRAGKVYPVQLALFAEMLKGRPWIPETLEQIGGVEGIGTQFLEETFEAEHAPVKQRMHADAARLVLQSLLPDPGTDVRTRLRSTDELQDISGYKDNKQGFRDLIQILDTDLRLISPTDRFESTVSGGSAASPNDSQDSYYSQEVARYQLSHDFLIPSLRDWVSRKQLETYQGRVSVQLADMAGLWSAKQASRFLPNWFEWIKFSLVVPASSRSAEQQQMMKYAHRRHLVSTAILLFCLIGSVWFFRSWQHQLQSDALLTQLASARLDEVQSISKGIGELPRSVEERVRQLASDDTLMTDRRLAAQLALFHWDSTDVQDILETALSEPLLPQTQIAVVGDFLHDSLEIDEQGASPKTDQLQLPDVWEWLWGVYEDQNQSDEKRLAACHLLLTLGQYSLPANAPRRDASASQLGKLLVEYSAFHPFDFSVLAEDFLPAKQDLVEPLSSTIGIAEPSLESSTAINFLVRFYEDDARGLADLALDASPWQLAILLPEISRHPDSVIPFLRDNVKSHTRSNLQSRSVSSRKAIRIATAGAILARLSESEPGLWTLLRLDPYPTLRATMIHRFADVGVPRERLMQRLVDEQKDGVFAALMLALGQYDPPKYSKLADATNERVLQAAVGAREPGTMSAATWLAKKWKLDLANQLSSPPGGTPASPNWHATSVGLVMARIDATPVSNIGRVYEIATTEVSVDQYQSFNPHAHYEDSISSTFDHPINIVRWHNAIQYCRWLSEQEGIPEDEMCYPPVDEIDVDFVPDVGHLKRSGYRLPTVAEWRHACLAETKGERFMGDNLQLMQYYAVFDSRDAAGPCGSLKPNDGGLFDMFGNIMEWTGDIDGDMRKLCGGSYGMDADQLRADFERSALPGTMFNSIGFRVARTLPVKTE